MNIGAHVSTQGGLYKAVERAEVLGCTAMQIFGASPRQWFSRLPEDKDVEKYKQVLKNSKINSVYLHAAYLVNLASPEKSLREKSVKNLSLHFQIANLIGADGLIFHIGSGKELPKVEAYKNVVDGIKKVLTNVKGSSKLIMENTAGGGAKIGNTVEEIGILFKKVKSGRLGVCIDTAHAFESGEIKEYSTKEIKEFVKKIDKAFGINNLCVLHVNDSKTKYASNHDRHENIGEGYIGLTAFKNLAKNSQLNKLPWLLEVPGYGNEGPDKKNIATIKKCFK